VFLLVLGILLIFVGVGAGVAGVLGMRRFLYVAQVLSAHWLGTKYWVKAFNPTSAVIGRMLSLANPARRGLILSSGIDVVDGGLWGTGAVLLGFYRMSRGNCHASRVTWIETIDEH